MSALYPRVRVVRTPCSGLPRVGTVALLVSVGCVDIGDRVVEVAVLQFTPPVAHRGARIDECSVRRSDVEMIEEG